MKKREKGEKEKASECILTALPAAERFDQLSCRYRGGDSSTTDATAATPAPAEVYSIHIKALS